MQSKTRENISWSERDERLAHADAHIAKRVKPRSDMTSFCGLLAILTTVTDENIAGASHILRLCLCQLD